MKHLLILLVLVCVAAPSSAVTNWLLLGKDGQEEIYIDAHSITRSPFYVKAWTMLSFRERQGSGWLSERRLLLYSCKERSMEWLQSIYYAERMGEGNVVQARAPTKYASPTLVLDQLDPSARDKNRSGKALAEVRYIATFESLC